MSKTLILKKILFIIMASGLSAIILLNQQCFAVDILGKSLNKIEKNIDENAGKKAVVKDIYNTNLSKAQHSKLNAISKTVSDVRVFVNKTYMCQLSETDIINILYYGNNSFKKDIDTLTIPGFQKPEEKDMKSSCSTFNVCMRNLDGNEADISTYSCVSKVQSLYDDIQENREASSKFTNRIEGDEYFWNGVDHDSTFDLLIDVRDVAKILFGEEGLEEVPEVLFFDVPELTHLGDAYSTPGTSVAPTTNVSTTTTSNTVDSTPQNNVEDTSTPITIVTQSIETGLDMDIDVSHFIQTVNTVEVNSKNVTTASIGNQCVSGFSYQFATGYTITDTGTIYVTGTEKLTIPDIVTYKEYTLEQIKQLQCNNDYICDNWESTTCPDCLPMGSGSDVLDEVADLIEGIDLSGSDNVITPQTLNCVNNCRQTQTSIEAKLLCVAKCFCMTYESSLFNPMDYPGMSPIFKLKMCVTPATQMAYKKTQKAYNIQTAFDEMLNIVQDVKNGGSTLPAVKTKTYLDSSYMQNKFGNVITVLITSSTKKHVSQTSEKDKEKEQKNTNKELMENVAHISSDPTIPSERNKYVVARTLSDEELTGNSNKIESLHESLENDIIINVDNQFSKFMSYNANFWKDVNRIFQSINTQSQILYDKRR